MVSHPLLCLRNKFIAQSAAAMQPDEGGVNTYIHLGLYLFGNTEKMRTNKKRKRKEMACSSNRMSVWHPVII